MKDTIRIESRVLKLRECNDLVIEKYPDTFNFLRLSPELFKRRYPTMEDCLKLQKQIEKRDAEFGEAYREIFAALAEDTDVTAEARTVTTAELTERFGAAAAEEIVNNLFAKYGVPPVILCRKCKKKTATFDSHLIGPCSCQSTILWSCQDTTAHQEKTCAKCKNDYRVCTTYRHNAKDIKADSYHDQELCSLA